MESFIRKKDPQGRIILKKYVGIDSEIVIPEDIVGIGASAFGTGKCKRVILHDRVELIGAKAFSNSELEEIYIPDSVREIGADAFTLCTQLKSIRFPAGLREISERCICYCPRLTQVIFPEQLRVIKRFAFSNCDRLENVVLPSCLEKIEKMAFADCSQLREISLPDKVTEIGEAVFLGCSSLESLTVPDGVESFCLDNLLGCNQLRELKCKNPGFFYPVDEFAEDFRIRYSNASGAALLAENYHSLKESTQRCIRITAETYPHDVAIHILRKGLTRSLEVILSLGLIPPELAQNLLLMEWDIQHKVMLVEYVHSHDTAEPEL